MNLVFHLLCNLCRSCFVAGWQDGTGPWRHQQPNLPRPRRNPRSSLSSTYRQRPATTNTRQGLFFGAIQRLNFYIPSLKKDALLCHQFKKIVQPRSGFNRFWSKGNWSTKDFSCGLNLELHSGLKPRKCIQSVQLQISSDKYILLNLCYWV